MRNPSSRMAAYPLPSTFQMVALGNKKQSWVIMKMNYEDDILLIGVREFLLFFFTFVSIEERSWNHKTSSEPLNMDLAQQAPTYSGNQACINMKPCKNNLAESTESKDTQNNRLNWHPFLNGRNVPLPRLDPLSEAHRNREPLLNKPQLELRRCSD